MELTRLLRVALECALPRRNSMLDDLQHHPAEAVFDCDIAIVGADAAGPALRRPVRDLAGAIAAIVATLLFAASPPLRAFEFATEGGAVTGYLDTTVSFGALWRTQGRSPGLIAIANGGTSRDINSDDGNLNYRKGELVEMPLRVMLDFLLAYRDFGLFARVDYLYDNALKDKAELGEHSKFQFADYTYLRDFYVYGKFDVFGHGLFVRAGNQAVNWGASTFIQNGINTLSPVDVTRLRTPDAEIKDALSPTPMLRVVQEITDQVLDRGDLDAAMGREVSRYAREARPARRLLQHPGFRRYRRDGRLHGIRAPRRPAWRRRFFPDDDP